MKLHILNDLHLEFESFTPPKTDSDVVILAGDIHVGKRVIPWIKEHFPNKTVIYVLGNHEFYGQVLPELIDEMKTEVAGTGTNIHLLENDKLVVGDVLFLGCTLWTDFNLFGNPKNAGFAASKQMIDFKRIRLNSKPQLLTPDDTIEIHKQSRAWLSNELSNANGKKVVVITHHAPSKQSSLECYKYDILSAAFASDLEPFIKSNNISIWVHGHMHNNNDYTVGNTRVISNPKGYPHENNGEFIPDLVIEI